MTTLMDGFLPLFQRIFFPQNRYSRPVGTDLIDRDIVKSKNIVNQFLFSGIN